MVRSTIIYRYDSIPLCGSVDDGNDPELIEQKNQIKNLVPKLNSNSEPQASLSSGSSFTIHYLISEGIYYFVICDKSYPRKLAFSYLQEISNEFYNSFGQEVANSQNLRPYVYIQFDNFLSKTKKVYINVRAQTNIDKLNSELTDVKNIMTKNIEDLLYRGDSLDKMTDLSSTLRNQSAKYRKAAQKINFDLLVRQYAPIAVAALIFVFLVWFIFLR